MNPLARTRLTSVIAVAIAAITLLPTTATAATGSARVTLTHAQLVAALSKVRAATASAESGGWRQTRVVTPGPDSTSWTTVTRYDGTSGRLTTTNLYPAHGPKGETFRLATLTLPNTGVWVGSRTGAGNYMAADQPVLDLLGSPNARYALWRNTWVASLRDGKRMALSQVVGGLLRSNATATVAHNGDGTLSYTVAARYTDEVSGSRLRAVFVLRVASDIVIDVVVRTQKALGVPAILRHLTEKFGPQRIVRPRAAESVLETDVALAAEARFLTARIVGLANGIAMAANQDAAATHRGATPADIRTLARLRVAGDGLLTPVTVTAISGGAKLSAITPFTHKTVVVLIRSVRGRAVVS